MGERGAEGGEEEPVDAEDGERDRVEELVGQARGHEGRRDQQQGAAHDRRDDEDLPARPSVDEDADEGAEHAVRQQQHRQADRHLERGRLLLGAEEGETHDAELEDPVGELRDQPGGEQPSEVAPLQDRAEIGGIRHDVSLAAVHGPNIGVNPEIAGVTGRQKCSRDTS
jgi:hypothetical protein